LSKLNIPKGAKISSYKLDKSTWVVYSLCGAPFKITAATARGIVLGKSCNTIKKGNMYFVTTKGVCTQSFSRGAFKASGNKNVWNIKYESQQACAGAKGSKFSFTFNGVCAKGSTKFSKVKSSTCSYTLQYKSPNACGKTVPIQ